MKKVFIVLLSFALFGCSVHYMKTVDYKPVANLSDNQSAIIFIRPDAFVGRAISSPIAEYKDGDATFIGNMKGACKILHITTPGKHDYLNAGGDGSILKLDLKPRMYYYVYSKPTFGTFVLIVADPLHEKDKLARYINSSSIPWIENTNDGLDWFEANKQSFITKYKRAISANRVSSFSKDAGTNSLIK